MGSCISVSKRRERPNRYDQLWTSYKLSVARQRAFYRSRGPLKMSPEPNSRFLKDLHQANEDGKTTGIKIWVIENGEGPYDLKASIRGPSSSPYEGGTFLLRIQFADYPFTAPRIKFVTDCFHPYIDPFVGRIALNMLKDDWNPALNLHTMLLSIQALLQGEFPEHSIADLRQYSLNQGAATLYATEPLEFERMAREFTELEAIPNTVASIARTLNLIGEEERIKELLRNNDWNVDRALALLAIENNISHGGSKEGLNTDDGGETSDQDGYQCNQSSTHSETNEPETLDEASTASSGTVENIDQAPQAASEEEQNAGSEANVN